MGKTLAIIEVSKKQDYIFSSKRLRTNVARSAEIAYVTGSKFFKQVAGSDYNEEENLVYAGGGHTVLQFAQQEQAQQFFRLVTRAAMERFPEMELFVKLLPYCPGHAPAVNLKALTDALEWKKALRSSSFYHRSLGLEKLDSERFFPVRFPERDDVNNARDPVDAPEGASFLLELENRVGYSFPLELEKLAGKDPFVAVIHIDGNAMGKRVTDIYEHSGENWEDCCRNIRRFSEGIQKDFEDAFEETVQWVIGHIPQDSALPIRPIILAGDDVCFVTAGSIGLEAASVFLKQLAAKSNDADKKPYAACAGVALVHTRYPFHRAYELADELCSRSAKRFGAGLDADGRVSAIDWHIEFGQLRGSLSSLREDYVTEDGCHLTLRPLAVLVPEEEGIAQPDAVRTYTFFQNMIQAIQRERGHIARGKLKELRTALRQGKVESGFFLQDREIADLLYHPLDARPISENERLEQDRRIVNRQVNLDKQAFVSLADGEYCLFFDAIELMDHYGFEEEGEETV